MGIAADQVTALVLAGGQSRRFGSDKAHALIDGRPMAMRVFDMLNACFSTVLISTGHADRTFDIPAKHIADCIPDAGPLGGIHAGLNEIQSTDAMQLFVAAVDLPFITTEAVQQLLQAADDTTDVVMGTDGMQPQPLFGCYHRKLLNPLHRFLANDDRAVRNFLKQLRTRTVLLPGDVLKNINHPADMPDSGKFQADR